MTVDPWHMYLITLARQGGMVRPPAIRDLFYRGWMVDQIAEVVGVTADEVRAALNHTP